MTTKTTPEGKVKRSVVDYLTKRGHWVLSHNTMGVFDPRTGGYRTSPYLTRGESDLMVLPKGRLEFMFIELKAPRGRLSDDQCLFRERVRSLGLEYEVVRSVADCVALGL
jgi:hypothetical protein